MSQFPCQLGGGSSSWSRHEVTDHGTRRRTPSARPSRNCPPGNAFCLCSLETERITWFQQPRSPLTLFEAVF